MCYVCFWVRLKLIIMFWYVNLINKITNLVLEKADSRMLLKG